MFCNFSNRNKLRAPDRPRPVLQAIGVNTISTNRITTKTSSSTFSTHPINPNHHLRDPYPPVYPQPLSNHGHPLVSPIRKRRNQIGLDNAGKSTILYKITMGEVVSTAPTVGANQELFEYKNLKIRMWDLGGQSSLRASWSSYYGHAKALIMVVDSTDRARLNLAKEELHRVASDPELSTQPGSNAACLLIMANKQDVKGCMTPAQVSEGLALTELRDRQWQIVACSALTGKGLMEGMDWIANQLKNQK